MREHRRGETATHGVFLGWTGKTLWSPETFSVLVIVSLYVLFLFLCCCVVNLFVLSGNVVPLFVLLCLCLCCFSFCVVVWCSSVCVVSLSVLLCCSSVLLCLCLSCCVCVVVLFLCVVVLFLCLRCSSVCCSSVCVVSQFALLCCSSAAVCVVVLFLFCVDGDTRANSCQFVFAISIRTMSVCDNTALEVLVLCMWVISSSRVCPQICVGSVT